MRFYSVILFSFIFLSCRNSADTGSRSVEKTSGTSLEVESKETYVSQKWHFSAEIPETFAVFDGELAGNSPVINFYDRSIKQEPPLAIGSAGGHSYIAVLPEGFGVDAPAGPRKTLDEWEGHLPLSFEVDPRNSYVYLLETGQPWAISLSFYAPPPGWNENGSINVFYEVKNFRAECFSSNTGMEIPVKDCNPTDGDAIKFYGKISEEKRAVLNSILKSLHFLDPERERESIGGIIKVEQPQSNQEVRSPLEISGKAKGYWFFEAEAPVSLVSESGKELARGTIRAKGDWMTEDRVPFKGVLEFGTKEKRGYLKFNRANASGQPEHDRVLRVPVIFH